MGSYIIDIGYQIPMPPQSSVQHNLAAYLGCIRSDKDLIINKLEELLNSFKDCDKDFEAWLKAHEIKYNRWWWVDRND